MEIVIENTVHTSNRIALNIQHWLVNELFSPWDHFLKSPKVMSLQKSTKY